MHGTDENQVAYHFCFQKRVELISDGAKVIELLSLYIYIYGEKYEIPLGWVRLEPTPATTAAPSPSESGDITTAPYAC